MTIFDKVFIPRYIIFCDYPDCKMSVHAIDENDLLNWDWKSEGDFLNGKHYCGEHSKEKTKKKEG